MKKTKTQKGITLVALIITIVVLLILAVVAITAIQNTGILEHANNAATKYNQMQEEENGLLNGYEGLLNNYAGTGSGSDSGTKTYTAYEVGDTVTIGTEEFYVIKPSSETEETVVLFAKECIDTTNLVQSASSNYVEFSATNYWVNEDGISFPYDLVEIGEPDTDHYAAYAAYQYGVKVGGTGRLMYYSEAEALYDVVEANVLDGLYWLGTLHAIEPGDLIFVIEGEIKDGFYDGAAFCVRPVVTISKSKLS